MRTWIKVAVTAAVLGGVLVGADRIALSMAQSRAADELAGRQGISGRPSVAIDDFPFLTDLIDKKLGSVHLSAAQMQLTGGGRSFQLQDFSAQLNGVQVDDGLRSATVDSGHGSGRISYQEVQSLMGLDARTSIAYGGPGQLKVGYEVLGQRITTTVKLRTQGNQVLVAGVGDLPGVGALPGVSGMVSSAIGSKSFTLQGLPVGLNLDQVAPQPDGLQLSFQGSKVHLVG
ncbi:LmeA family phospholipid-binding protein [Kitasatospora azatica]|uniref:LmeA family phospholipid-binding protein n=1 Tax=Kitasatospora azatica TaxID=58347 RepID=UPI00055C1F2D|nr:DUF2993 domain-containing protein [Kitasatospora azatica]